MAPSTIYGKPLFKMLDTGIKVRGMSHITGGGITGNLPRAFAKGIAAVVDTQGWKRPAIFDWLQEKGGVAQDEMWSVVNCGVGFVLIVPRRKAEAAMARLQQAARTRVGSGQRVSGRVELGGS